MNTTIKLEKTKDVFDLKLHVVCQIIFVALFSFAVGLVYIESTSFILYGLMALAFLFTSLHLAYIFKKLNSVLNT